MHSAPIAERILGLVTSRDHAEAIVGDLTEAAGGAMRFWSKVLRTAASLLLHQLTDHPARLIALSLLGIAVYVAIDLLFAGLSGLAFFIAAFASGNHVHVDSIGWKIWFALPVLVSSLLIGRILARWAPGRELAACIVYAALVSIYNLVPALGDNGVLHAVFCILLVAAGATWGRHLRHSAGRPRPL